METLWVIVEKALDLLKKQLKKNISHLSPSLP
jgi:hypothetical protein